MTRRLGVGIIGVGTVGRRHAENLARHIPHGRLVAVADARFDVARSVAADLDVPNAYATADELAAHPDVEAIVIASTHHAHLEGILAAARHRKDVLCEKPITPTLDQADQALAAVEAAGVRLQIGFMRRYDAAYAAAKSRIDAGEIGEPDPSLPPSMQAAGDVGVFVDTCIHDYDNARWLLGDEVTEVHAVAAPVLEPGRPDDLALSTLRFARGGLGSVEAYLTDLRLRLRRPHRDRRHQGDHLRRPPPRDRLRRRHRRRRRPRRGRALAQPVRRRLPAPAR
jgi:predicted dehydrogenase